MCAFLQPKIATEKKGDVLQNDELTNRQRQRKAELEAKTNLFEMFLGNRTKEDKYVVTDVFVPADLVCQSDHH